MAGINKKAETKEESGVSQAPGDVFQGNKSLLHVVLVLLMINEVVSGQRWDNSVPNTKTNLSFIKLIELHL